MPVQQVSDSELELMRIIWQRGGQALFSEIMDGLGEKGLDWKKNTVLTLLSRLVEKGALSTRKIGRRNEYVALVAAESYLAHQTKSFVNRVYEGDVGGLIATLLRQDMVSEEDADELRKFWSERGKGDA